MEKIVEKVAQLTATLNQFSTKTKISLPRIAVVGQQSSGKSSVLEGIIGMDILPRAAGLCTRVPLILSIIKEPRVVKNIIGKFTHLSESENRQFQSKDASKNADAIREEVLRRTNELTKPGELKNSPITLSIYSSDFPNLNLVDLPGLTKISTSGQSATVVKDIENMVRDFISSESTIILAVVPANSDLANSDSLQIAQEYDPHGLRTLGIVTKLDLMDKGTSAISILKNQEFFLKLGYIGVISRGQLDLQNKTSVEHSLKKAQQFFSMHEDYSEIQHECGFPFLKTRLGEIFSKHVKTMLPQLSNELTNLHEQKALELSKLGGDNISKEQKLNNALNSFSKVIEDYIRGKIPVKFNSTLFGGAKLKRASYTNLKEEFDKAVDSTNQNEISELNLQVMGVDSSLLFGEKTFNTFVQREIVKLEKPIKEAAFAVTFEMSKLIDTSLKESLIEQYPRLMNLVGSKLKDVLKDQKKILDDKISGKIYVESNHINVDHPEFFQLPLDAFQYANEKVSKNIPHHERSLKIQGIVTSRLVNAYLDIVKRTLLDGFVKIAQKEIVRPIVDEVRESLFAWVIGQKDCGKLVEENPKITARRKMLEKELESIKSGIGILEKITLE